MHGVPPESRVPPKPVAKVFYKLFHSLSLAGGGSVLASIYG